MNSILLAATQHPQHIKYIKIFYTIDSLRTWHVLSESLKCVCVYVSRMATEDQQSLQCNHRCIQKSSPFSKTWFASFAGSLLFWTARVGCYICFACNTLQYLTSFSNLCEATLSRVSRIKVSVPTQICTCIYIYTWWWAGCWIYYGLLLCCAFELSWAHRSPSWDIVHRPSEFKLFRDSSVTRWDKGGQQASTGCTVEISGVWKSPSNQALAQRAKCIEQMQRWPTARLEYVGIVKVSKIGFGRSIFVRDEMDLLEFTIPIASRDKHPMFLCNRDRMAPLRPLLTHTLHRQRSTRTWSEELVTRTLFCDWFKPKKFDDCCMMLSL